MWCNLFGYNQVLLTQAGVLFFAYQEILGRQVHRPPLLAFHSECHRLVPVNTFIQLISYSVSESACYQSDNHFLCQSDSHMLNPVPWITECHACGHIHPVNQLFSKWISMLSVKQFFLVSVNQSVTCWILHMCHVTECYDKDFVNVNNHFLYQC